MSVAKLYLSIKTYIYHYTVAINFIFSTNFNVILLMKKHQLKNYLKLGALFFGIILLITNCETDKEDNAATLDNHIDNSIVQISAFELTQNTLFNNLNTALNRQEQATQMYSTETLVLTQPLTMSF